MRYAVVTVVHRADFDWLRLQAHSLRRYLPPALVDEIVVVENSPEAAPGWAERARTDYGPLGGALRVIDGRSLARPAVGTSGWVTQQILKLAIARAVRSERYLLLDAKNHLLFPLARDFLEAGPRIRSRRVRYDAHPMRAYLERTARYMGLDPVVHLGAFLPTVTPFVLPTALAREIVAAVEAREGEAFAAAFARLEVSEFFLVAAFLVARGTLEAHYDLSGAECPTVWEESVAQGPGEVARLVSQAEPGTRPFFAVHRRAVPRLDDASRLLIAELWRRRGLFRTAADGVAFLRRQAARAGRAAGPRQAGPITQSASLRR